MKKSVKRSYHHKMILSTLDMSFKEMKINFHENEYSDFLLT